MDLFEHDPDLACDLVFVEGRVPHRVHQDIEPVGEHIRGQCRVVDRDVEARVRVDLTAHTLDLAGDLAHATALGPLEEHVLVKMREPRLVGGLVRRADPCPDLQGAHRHGVRLAEQQGQAVGKGLEVDVGFRHASAG